MRQILEHVETRDALLCQQCRRASLRLLKNGGKQIADLSLLTLCALDVQHGGLKRAPERRGLFGLAFLPARERFNRFVEAVAHIAAQQMQIGAARREDALAVRIVGERVEQMFECQICMTP